MRDGVGNREEGLRLDARSNAVQRDLERERAAEELARLRSPLTAMIGISQLLQER